MEKDRKTPTITFREREKESKGDKENEINRVREKKHQQ